MPPSRQQILDDLFLRALELPPEQWPMFLEENCGGDADLRGSLQTLLEADAAAGCDQFLRSAFMNDLPVEPNSPLPPIADHHPSDEIRFQIISKHEQGGLGEVLIAYDRQLRREVAVKQIRPKWQSHEEARQRFVQEAEVTGRLEHPGVVPVYAMGHWEDGREYYAMRFIEGDTLAEVIEKYHASTQDKQDRQRELRKLLNRFVDVCNTIDYAHNKKVLHRDIKPSNIMVGPYGETLVLDWGLAKLLDSSFDESMTAQMIGERSSGSGSTPTQAGGRIGTPQYMSPEQASGQLDEISVRTDIYLLGATLYQILTGQPPHQSESIEKLLKKVASGDLVPPRQIDSGISPALEAICVKAMHANSVKRYESAASLARDVESWLADEPVAVHRDSWTVRLARWVRRHRTAATSLAVAATLLTIGSVAGSLIWDIQRIKQAKLRTEKQQRDMQLRVERQQRDVERKALMDAASELADKELQASRYSSALGFLQNATEAADGSVSDQPQLQEQQDELKAKAERLQRLVSFYHFADIHERLNVMSRDTKAITACLSGLDALGIVGIDDWWFRLPDEDLSAKQKDQLRWDVYQQFMMLDAMLVKLSGIRLIGSEKMGGSKLLRGARRFLQTNAGKREAAAGLVVSDRIEGFRLSEASRWYRSVGAFRFGKARRLHSNELGLTRNATDAQSLGVLCMIAGLDPDFRILFNDYQGDEPLRAAHDLFNRSATLRPEHYWTHLSLAQVEFLMAMKKPDCNWRDVEIAVQAIGRCIAINPENCFAHADRSTMYREQARLIEKDESIDAAQRLRRVSELRQWSLADAELAARLGMDQPRVGWQYGLALYEVGQSGQAFEQFLRASKLTFPLINIQDAAFLLVDDLRGRQEAGQVIEKLSAQPGSAQAKLLTLLATIRLNQNAFDEALLAATKAIDLGDAPAHAYAVRGMINLQRDALSAAQDDFVHVLADQPDHDWAVYGLSRCNEASKKYDEALQGYRHGQRIAQTSEHRAASLLGQSRVLGLTGEYELATDAITMARELEPACDIMTVVKPLAIKYGKLKKADPNSKATLAFKAFLQRLSKLPRVTNIAFPKQRTFDQQYRAAVLNGDFELGTLRYWSDATGASWLCEDENESTAVVTKTESHSGGFSLQVTGHEKGTARCGQTFPLPVGRRCRVVVWARGRHLSQGGASIEAVPIKETAIDSVDKSVVDKGAVIRLPEGSFGWTKFVAVLDLPEKAGVEAFVPARLKVISSDEGQFWLDDIQVFVEPKQVEPK